MFNEAAKKKINDLERELRTLRDLQQRQSQPRIAIPSGALAIGRRLPWVAYKLTWTYINSTYGYGLSWLPEVTGTTGPTYWGSEIDACVHASEDSGFYTWPKFDIVGIGTWLVITKIMFNNEGSGNGSAVSSFTYWGQLQFLDTETQFSYPLGQDFSLELEFTSVHNGGAGLNKANTLEFQTLIQVGRKPNGAPSPDIPMSLWMSFILQFSHRRLPNTLVEASFEKPLLNASVLFIRLDPEDLRRVRMLLPGDGVEEVDPPPDPEPDPDPLPDPGENTPPGGPTPP